MFVSKITENRNVRRTNERTNEVSTVGFCPQLVLHFVLSILFLISRTDLIYINNIIYKLGNMQPATWMEWMASNGAKAKRQLLTIT